MYYFGVSAAPGVAATMHKEPSYAGVRDTYAVVEIGGHQLIVEEGRWYTVNRLEVSQLFVCLFCFVLFCFALHNLCKVFFTLLECITFNCFCAVG